jgi:hypothetical protein
MRVPGFEPKPNELVENAKINCAAVDAAAGNRRD